MPRTERTKRKRRLWRLAIALLLGAVTAFVLLNVLAYNHAWAMTHFAQGGSRTASPDKLSWGQKLKVLVTGIRLPRPAGTSTPSDVGLPFEPLSIPGEGSLQLGAWYCPNPQPRALVLLFHGYGGDKSCLLREAAALFGLRCSVLLVDFRGSGQSSEACTTLGYAEGEDVACAVRLARQRWPKLPLVLYGQSMGGAAILRAVHADGVAPDGVIVESVFDTLRHTAGRRCRIMGVPEFPAASLLLFWGGQQVGFDAFAHNPVEYAASVRCPILFLHGADDPLAAPEDARSVYAAVPEPEAASAEAAGQAGSVEQATARKRFVAFAGTGHQSCVRRAPDEWLAAVGAFLDSLSDKPAEEAPLTRQNPGP